MKAPRPSLLVMLVLLLAGLSALVVSLWLRAKPSSEPAVTWSESGCAEALTRPGRDLPFELFARSWPGVRSSSADFPEMRLYLLSSREDISQMRDILKRPELEALAAVDFEQYAVIAVFDGIKGNLCPGIAIEQVRQVGVALVVFAQHWGRPPNEECAAAMGNPFDIVLVARDGAITEGMPLMLCAQIVPSPTLQPR